MQTKVSEKSILLSLVLFIAASIAFTKIQLMATPVRISEAGIAYTVAAAGLLAYSIYLFKKSFVKM